MRFAKKISIIMPAFNSDKFINSAIESVLKQTFDDWELLIVDDGSQDNTVDAILSFRDNRIKLIRLDKNYGNYHARNIGIRASSSKYVAMFDSDDICHSNRLEIQYNFLEKRKDIGAIGTNFL